MMSQGSLVLTVLTGAGWALLVAATVAYLTRGRRRDRVATARGEDRFLFTDADALTREVVYRVAVTNESDAFIGLDARTRSFIVHAVAVPAHGRHRNEIWVFDHNDNFVTLDDIPFPVTGTFVSDMEAAR